MFKPSKKNINFKPNSISLVNKEKIKLSINKVSNIGGMPQTNSQLRIITKSVINSFDILLSVFENSNKIEDLTIVSYRIGKKVVIELNELQKQNKIKNITILISGGMRRLMPDVYNAVKSFESEKFIIKEAESHAKITLIKSNNNFYVIEGSGNMNTNAKIEQYIIDNDILLYNFHKDWIDKI